ncbi:MAG: hypothetical protein H6816_07260 [Phycisphaerales bacterium]|nr:hypothetical protein [Phycisphaerales bacterium]
MQQLVWMHLAKGMRGLKYDPALGRFRDYLRRVLRNAIARHFARPDPPNGALARIFQCAAKRRVSSVGVDTHPATVAPAGSNRSGRGGNEAAEAFDVEGRMATWRADRP